MIGPVAGAWNLLVFDTRYRRSGLSDARIFTRTGKANTSPFVCRPYAAPFAEHEGNTCQPLSLAHMVEIGGQPDFRSADIRTPAQHIGRRDLDGRRGHNPQGFSGGAIDPSRGLADQDRDRICLGHQITLELRDRRCSLRALGAGLFDIEAGDQPRLVGHRAICRLSS